GTRATWHRCRNREQLLIIVGEFPQSLADDLRVSRSWRRCGFATLNLVFAESVEFVRLFDRRLIAFAFFGENMQKHWFLLRFQKFESTNQQRNIVSVDRPVIAQAQLFE